MDNIRDQIAREVRRGQISGNLSLILRNILDDNDALRAELAEVKASLQSQVCPTCACRRDWATGAKV